MAKKIIPENKTQQEYPPVGFYFSVSILGNTDTKDARFKEVSGISTEMELEAIKEGGENRFTHQVPKGIKHGNLVLKRGIAPTSSKLVAWVKETLEGDFTKPISTNQVLVNLLDEFGKPLYSWSFDNVFPVKWEISPFDSMKNEVAIETIELSYTYMTRTL